MSKKSRVLHRQPARNAALAVGGHGVWLVDADGREVLDSSGGAAVFVPRPSAPARAGGNGAAGRKLIMRIRASYLRAAEALADELVVMSPAALATPTSSARFGGDRGRAENGAPVFLEIGQPHAPLYRAAGRAITAIRSARSRPAAMRGRRGDRTSRCLADAFSHVDARVRLSREAPDESDDGSCGA